MNVDTSNLMKKKVNDSDLDMNNHDVKNVNEIGVKTIVTTLNLSVTREAMAKAIVYKNQNLLDFDVVNKSYLDSRIQFFLKTDGSNKMTTDLDAGKNKIINLKEPTESDTTAAANVSYVNKMKTSVLNDVSNLHKKIFFGHLCLTLNTGKVTLKLEISN